MPEMTFAFSCLKNLFKPQTFCDIPGCLVYEPIEIFAIQRFAR